MFVASPNKRKVQ